MPKLLSSPYVLGGAALALSLGSGWAGWTIRDADYQAHLKKDARAAEQAQKDARQVELKLESGSQEVRDVVAQENVRTEIVYRTVTKEVPVYVTQTKFAQDVDAGGGLPAGLVWTYNRAASNSEAPIPPGLDPDAPTGTGVSTLATITAGNFALCYQWRAEAQGWRDWYEKLRADWPTAQAEEKKK